jgi:hypothetical protein
MKRLIILNALLLILSCALFSGCCKECRVDFYQTMEKQIQALDVRIDELQAKAAKQGEAGKAKFAQAMEHLQSLKKAAQAKLAALKNASDDAWQEMKPALSEAMTNLETGFEKAKSHFNQDEGLQESK